MSAYAAVSRAWDLYRHAQTLPVPRKGAGPFFTARSRLFRAAEPYACHHRPVSSGAIKAIEEAAGELAAVIGGEGSVAA